MTQWLKACTPLQRTQVQVPTPTYYIVKMMTVYKYRFQRFQCPLLSPEGTWTPMHIPYTNIYM